MTRSFLPPYEAHVSADTVRLVPVEPHPNDPVSQHPLYWRPWCVTLRRDPDDERHGSASTYNNVGCRCAPCTGAHSVRHREYMHAHPEQRERQRVRDRKRWLGR